MRVYVWSLVWLYWTLSFEDIWSEIAPSNYSKALFETYLKSFADFYGDRTVCYSHTGWKNSFDVHPGPLKFWQFVGTMAKVCSVLLSPTALAIGSNSF